MRAQEFGLRWFDTVVDDDDLQRTLRGGARGTDGFDRQLCGAVVDDQQRDHRPLTGATERASTGAVSHRCRTAISPASNRSPAIENAGTRSRRSKTVMAFSSPT